MRFVHQFADEPLPADMRKPRLEVLLSAWRSHYPWLWVQDGRLTTTGTEEYVCSEQDWPLWRTVIQHAEPIPPRTHIDGLRTHAASLGLNVEELESRGVVRIVGPRVAVRRFRDPASEIKRLGGYTWALRVRLEALGPNAPSARAMIGRVFRKVTGTEHELLAAEPLEGAFPEAAIVLLDHALVDSSEASLFRLWSLACAFRVQDGFTAQLPAPARNTLGSQLLCELDAVVGQLDLRTDTVLERFADGHGDVPIDSISLPAMSFSPSRLSLLLQADQFYSHQHREIGDHYFDDVAVGYASVANVCPVGELLKRLPPGRAHLSVVEHICSKRPELIASYLWHPGFHAEGAFALLQLPQSKMLGVGQSISLAEEWAEVQRIGRELLLLADKSEDWASVIALGIHDETRAIAWKHFARHRAHGKEERYEDVGLWAQSVADGERAAHHVENLVRYLRAKTHHSEAAMVFALRLLAPLRQHHRAEQAGRLAHALLDCYVMSLQLDAEVLNVPHALPAYPELLEELRSTLVSDTASTQRWLQPFDIAEYIKQARTGSADAFDSREVNPRFDVPRILLGHAEVLVAQASASSEPEPILNALVDLILAELNTSPCVGAFSWDALARTTAVNTPVTDVLFVRLGRVLGRLDSGTTHLDRLLSATPEAHILAYLAVGLGPDSPFAETIRQPLRIALNAVLADENGVALGHALELANTLHQAGMGRDAERLARQVLRIAERLRPHLRRPYVDSANALIAGALAQQEMWPELLAFTPDTEDQHKRLFVDNMRALALSGVEKHAQAEALLNEILQKDPSNATALVNRTAVYSRAGDWNRVIGAAEQARAQLSESDCSNVALNEAFARERMGDTFGARSILESLTQAGISLQGEALLKKLASPCEEKTAIDTDASSVSHPEQPTSRDTLQRRLVAEEAQDRGVDVAIVTALQEEYDAVYALLEDVAPVPSEATRQFPNLYSWVLGSVRKSDGDGFHRVVLAVAGQSGNLRSLSTTLRTVDQWKPRHVLFSGIAGGLAKNSLKQGDLVLSEAIWHYEYGKVVDGEYLPRQRDSFRAHSGLVNSARTFQSQTADWTTCSRPPPVDKHCPACVCGTIGSGEKVIDDLEPAFVQAILKARPDLQAIEMEAAGAAIAIEHLHEEGESVGFMMVRGISDMPRAVSTVAAESPGTAGAGTAERDTWKRYASAIAASFVARWIASPWWPADRRR